MSSWASPISDNDVSDVYGMPRASRTTVPPAWTPSLCSGAEEGEGRGGALDELDEADAAGAGVERARSVCARPPACALEHSSAAA